ncbi:MAG: trypsin-like peptidase domain-containing protein [Clostridia bacterium]|nr:trypsin-like peptidase domain-containing protein [Clostridia bacterium]
MKKKIALPIIAVLLIAIMFSLCACWQLTSVDDSFPFEAAVTRGEEGSRESWLAGLDAPASSPLRRAYDEAVADGSFEGTYFEFLKELGVESGNDAYVQSALRSVVTIFATFAPPGILTMTNIVQMGSGVIYSLDKARGDALIVTNYHVIYNHESAGHERVAHISDEITLFLYGGESTMSAIEATYLGGAMEYDIAVLKVVGSPILRETATHAVYAEEVVAANSDSVTVGERVYAIGNPLGDGMSVTEGIVSVEAEYINVYDSAEKEILMLLEIRTDAAINEGNSGGGLFNGAGELIGIVNAGSDDEDVEGFGFAIPSNLALSLAQNIIDTCAATPGSRGAAVANLDITIEVWDSHAAFDSETGKFYIEEKTVVSEVSGLARSMGLREGDTLVSASLRSSRGGTAYTRTVELRRAYMLENLLFEVRRGDILALTVSRNNSLKTIAISYSNSSYFTLIR